MTKRQPAYSAVPQSCRNLSARPVLTRQVHDSENAFRLLALLAPVSRWCQMPTFWLSLHSRCHAAYQFRMRVRIGGNPGVLIPARTQSRIAQRASSFPQHPVSAKPTYGMYWSRSNRVSSPRHIFFPEGNNSQAPDWLPANVLHIFSHLALDSALPPV